MIASPRRVRPKVRRVPGRLVVLVTDFQNPAAMNVNMPKQKPQPKMLDRYPLIVGLGCED